MKCKYKLVKNKMRCKICGEIIESKTTHDFQGCKCFRESEGTTGCAVDGGLSYARRLGNPDEFEDLSEWRPFTNEEVDRYNDEKILLSEQYPGLFKIDLMEYYDARMGNDTN